jgi:hypothetical protein
MTIEKFMLSVLVLDYNRIKPTPSTYPKKKYANCVNVVSIIPIFLSKYYLLLRCVKKKKNFF